MRPGQLVPSSMRVARPVRRISASVRFYVEVLGLEHLGGFAGHEGYDGAFVGPAGGDWHLELTSHTSGLPTSSPTDEDLLVLYLSPEQFRAAIDRLAEAGVERTRHPNPYWDGAGAAVYRDPDGYLLVLCPAPT